MDDIENTLRALDGVECEIYHNQSSQFLVEHDGEEHNRSDVNSIVELLSQLQDSITEKQSETLQDIKMQQPTTEVDSSNADRHKLSTNSTASKDKEDPADNITQSQCFPIKRHSLPGPRSHLPFKKRYIKYLNSDYGADLQTSTDDKAKNRCCEQNAGKIESESVIKSILNDEPIKTEKVDTKSASNNELKSDADAGPVTYENSEKVAHEAKTLPNNSLDDKPTPDASIMVMAITTTENHSVYYDQNETITETSFISIYEKEDLTPFPLLARDPRYKSDRSIATKLKCMTPDENEQTKTAQMANSKDTNCSNVYTNHGGYQQSITQIIQVTSVNSFPTQHSSDLKMSPISDEDHRNASTTKNYVELQQTMLSTERNSVELQRQWKPKRHEYPSSSSKRSSSVSSNDSKRRDHRDDRRDDRPDYRRNNHGSNRSNIRLENLGNNGRNYHSNNHRNDRRHEDCNYRRGYHCFDHRENRRQNHRNDHGNRRDDRRGLNSSSAAHGRQSMSRSRNGNRNYNNNLSGECYRRGIEKSRVTIFQDIQQATYPPIPYKLQEIDFILISVNVPRDVVTSENFNWNDPRICRRVPKNAEYFRKLLGSRI